MNATLQTLERPVQWVRRKADSLPCNVGKREQRMRLIGGTALIAAAIAAPVHRGWRAAFAALGVMEIVTGATRYCPVWQSLGISTNKWRWGMRE